MAVCDGKCFECKYDDCINNSTKGANIFEKDTKKAEQRERKKEYMRRYYQEHKEHYNNLMAKWRENNPDYNKNYYWQKKGIELVK